MFKCLSSRNKKFYYFRAQFFKLKYVKFCRHWTRGCRFLLKDNQVFGLSITRTVKNLASFWKLGNGKRSSKGSSLITYACTALMNKRQLHILFNSAKTWLVIVCWFLYLVLNLPELSLKLFRTPERNNFRFNSDKFLGKHRVTGEKCQFFKKRWHSRALLVWPYSIIAFEKFCFEGWC